MSTLPAPSELPSRRRSKATQALVAATITGSIAVAGIAGASAASAATVTGGTKAIDPGLQTSLDIVLKPQFPPGGCIVCGLGGFDPLFEGIPGGL